MNTVTISLAIIIITQYCTIANLNNVTNTDTLLQLSIFPQLLGNADDTMAIPCDRVCQ